MVAVVCRKVPGVGPTFKKRAGLLMHAPLGVGELDVRCEGSVSKLFSESPSVQLLP